MGKQYTSIKEQIEYGIESIETHRTVEVPLRDLLYIYQTLGEYVRFFHNSSHYPNLEAVEKFLGNSNSGAIGPLNDCYYEKLRNIIPKDISDQYDGGAFDNPNSPYYYKPLDQDTL